ncbi:MAG TPA: hypothetical protein VF384_12505 [Planctomycetota bacterium]
MPRCLAAAAILGFLSTMPLPAQREEPLGKNGWRVQLPAHWRRELAAEGYGDSQFQIEANRGLFGRSQPVAIAAREWIGGLDDEDDHRRAFAALDPMPDGVQLRSEREADWLRVTRTGTVEADGLAYRSELLVVDGGALHLLAWAEPAHAAALDAKVEEFLDAVLIPGDGSPWRKGMQPATEVLERSGVRLSLSLPPLVWQRSDDAASLRLWSSVDQQDFLYILDASRGASERVIDAEVRTFTQWEDTFRVVSRGVRTIDGIECHELAATSQHFHYRHVFVPAGGKRWLVVRYVVRGNSERPNSNRDAVLASLRLQPVVADAGLPPLPPAPPQPEQPVAAAWRTFLDGASPVFTVDGFLLRSAPGANGEWLAWDGSGATVFAPGDAHGRPLAGFEGQLAAFVCWRGAWLAAGYDGRVQVAAGAGADAPQAPSFRAERLAVAGDDLLCVRDAPFALLSASSAGRSELVCRRPDGSERVVAKLTSERVTDLAASADGKRALVALHRGDGFGDTIALAAIDLADGARRPVGAWQRIDQLGESDDGWLVTGVPRGGIAGIWHLRDGAEPELLLSGNGSSGARLARGVLAFAHRRGVSQAPLAHCQAAGRGVQPFSATHLAALGDALMRDEPAAPRTAEEVLAAVTSLRRRAREATGHDLPGDRGGLDALVGSDGVRANGAGARVVVALLLAADGLAAGGEWIAGSGADWWSWCVRGDEPAEHAFAIPCNVATAVAQALEEYGSFGMEGWRDDRSGPRLLLGVDGNALTAAAAACVPAGFAEAWQAGDAKVLVAAANALPANRRLRARVQERLADCGDWPALEAFAREHAQAAGARPGDVVAWLLARASQQPPGTGSADVLDALQKAVQQHPREARLYWLLASQHERAGKDAIRRARACYDRVAELQEYGELGMAALAALQRLDGK